MDDREIGNWKPELPDLKEPVGVMDYRAAVVAAAEADLGLTDPNPIWLEVYGSVPVPAPGKRIHWCGAAALRWLRRGGLVDWQWSFKRSQPGFIWRIGYSKRILTERGKLPLPGDVAYKPQAAHHAIVSGPAFERDGALWVPTIDGNSGPAPGVVARHERELSRRDVYYYPIAGLIDDAFVRDRTPAEPPV